ncbi:hypothetical protein [Thalassotalea atypica]|uniref:hypothetical protein n=1 Tax=Thalassotalea atypica TaxID=2054316 RepID=UPI0025736CAD|nr:hypothetical protein [Thalassotalea atypica]
MASCFKNWLNCMRACSRLPGTANQIACAADCDLDLARCVRDSLFMSSSADALVLARSIRSGFPIPLELLVQDESSGESNTEFNLGDMVDKAFEDKPLSEIADASVSAIMGISVADAKVLEKAFNIKTVRDFANHDFVRYARSIVAQADNNGC